MNTFLLLSSSSRDRSLNINNRLYLFFIFLAGFTLPKGQQQGRPGGPGPQLEQGPPVEPPRVPGHCWPLGVHTRAETVRALHTRIADATK